MSDARRYGTEHRVSSGSALNRLRTDYGIPCDGLQAWTLCRTTDISTRRDVAPRDGAVRAARDRAAGEPASVRPNSRCLLAHMVQKCLPLFPGEELDKPQSRLQENTITVEPFAVCGQIFARVKEIKF